MPIGGGPRDALDGGRFVEVQPREVDELHQLGFVGILVGESLEGRVEIQEFVEVFAGHDERRKVVEFDALELAAALEGVFGPGVLHEDPPHRLGGGGEEMCRDRPSVDRRRLPAAGMLREPELWPAACARPARSPFVRGPVSAVRRRSAATADWWLWHRPTQFVTRFE